MSKKYRNSNYTVNTKNHHLDFLRSSAEGVESKKSGPKGPAFRISGVPPEADQVSGKKNKKKLKPETSFTGRAI